VPHGAFAIDDRMRFKDLFRPRWRHSDPRVRLEAVRSLADQPILSEIASTDPSMRVALAAVVRITDQASLAKIATLAIRWSSVRIEALKRVADQALLVKVASNDWETSQEVRIAAATCLTDARLQVLLARTSPFRRDRFEIADRIRDPVVAQRIFHELASDRENDLDLRIAAAGRLDAVAAAPILSRLEEEREAAGRLLEESFRCPKCRQRHARESCSSTRKTVRAAEDGAADSVLTTYYCPRCAIEVGSGWGG
jgi:hypothetical protein